MQYLQRKIKDVLEYPDAIVCDVDLGDYSTYEPRIFGWKTPIEDSVPSLSREEFKSNMMIKMYDGWENPAQPGNGEVGMGLS